MRLKYRFLTQNILVLLITVIITACIGYAYICFYNMLGNHSILSGIPDTYIIVMKNDEVIYQSRNFSDVQVKEMLVNLSIKKNEFFYKNTKYRLEEESFITKDNHQYRVVKLLPVIQSQNYSISFIGFVMLVFLITFIITNTMVQKQNMKNIINPIINLTKETEKLRMGELKTAILDEGYDEVRELSNAIEQLRIKLNDSLYYQQKINEDRKFLISSISHDLKTPVTAIRGYIEGILEGIADTEGKKQEYLKKAIEKTKVINKIIEDLLLYSKLDLNQIPFEVEKIDIIKYMESCVEDNYLQFKREGKQIHVENQLTDKQFVLIDSERFQRVIQNIVDNAKKNIAVGDGKLIIKLRETHSSIILEFKDNGKGIKSEDLPHIFERFYRADSARKAEGSSGLGLAIAKQIVEGLGGRIWAVSKPGEGTSIMISLKKVL